LAGLVVHIHNTKIKILSEAFAFYQGTTNPKLQVLNKGNADEGILLK